jgi:hypothetical protein
MSQMHKTVEERHDIMMQDERLQKRAADDGKEIGMRVIGQIKNSPSNAKWINSAII